MQKLSIWIQSFEEMRNLENNYVYVDKTKILVNLIKEWAKYNFLNRPRRFGKSLMLDTIACLFRWKKELFEWLYAENNWNFSKKYPVIQISFWTGVLTVEELQNKLDWLINIRTSQETDIVLGAKNISDKFQELIMKLNEKYGNQVVILVDEYDKPILDFLDNEEKAKEAREILKSFYGVIKDSDKYIKYVFISWVSKFSKVSLFSGLNNLQDLTINEKVWELCGFTLRELQTNFSSFLHWIEQEKMKKWYNGFNFLWQEKVFNPFDILLFLDNKEYRNYWFETATPSFLMKILKKKEGFYHIPYLENIQTNEKLIWSFDIEKIKIETLLFQTGYLTIKEKSILFWKEQYTLWIPNFEIETSLNNYILTDYLEVFWDEHLTQRAKPVYEALISGNIDEIIIYLKKIFAGISYTNRLEILAKYEWYYSSIIYTLMYTMWLDIIQEDITSEWRIDLTIKILDNIYILEFKVEKSGKQALEQIKAKNYVEKYLWEKSKNIFLLWIDFDFEKRNIWAYDWEKI